MKKHTKRRFLRMSIVVLVALVALTFVSYFRSLNMFFSYRLNQTEPKVLGADLHTYAYVFTTFSAGGFQIRWAASMVQAPATWQHLWADDPTYPIFAEQSLPAAGTVAPDGTEHKVDQTDFQPFNVGFQYYSRSQVLRRGGVKIAHFTDIRTLTIPLHLVLLIWFVVVGVIKYRSYIRKKKTGPGCRECDFCEHELLPDQDRCPECGKEVQSSKTAAT